MLMKGAKAVVPVVIHSLGWAVIGQSYILHCWGLSHQEVRTWADLVTKSVKYKISIIVIFYFLWTELYNFSNNIHTLQFTSLYNHQGRWVRKPLVLLLEHWRQRSSVSLRYCHYRRLCGPFRQSKGGTRGGEGLECGDTALRSGVTLDQSLLFLFLR